MWFSTSRGILYSDGIETYELPDTLTRRFVYRIALLKDEDGILWIYSANGVPTILENSHGGWSELSISKDLKRYFSSKIQFFLVLGSLQKNSFF